MADAVGCVTKAVELALKIKDAVDTVRQNSKDCAHIKRRVERVRHTLSLCEGNAELMESPAVRNAVEALDEVLGEALELVTGCQEETNAVCLYCTAGKLSKQLGKVDRGISDGNSEATFAILVYHISKQTRDGAPPPTAMPTETGEIIPQSLVINKKPDPAKPVPPPPAMPTEPLVHARIRPPSDATLVSNKKPEQVTPSGFSSAPPPAWPTEGRIRRKAKRFDRLEPPLHFQNRMRACYEGDGALLREIARVTLAIRTAVETVRRNKDECVEIDKFASRANVLLSQLEDTETTKDTMLIGGALKNLLRTFRYAHQLVAACQRRSVVVLCSPGKLSSELRGVLDEMMLGLADLIGVLL